MLNKMKRFLNCVHSLHSVVKGLRPYYETFKLKRRRQKNRHFMTNIVDHFCALDPNKSFSCEKISSLDKIEFAIFSVSFFLDQK